VSGWQVGGWLWVYLSLGLSVLCIATAVQQTLREMPASWAPQEPKAEPPALPAARVVRGGR
jgi:hypothetical protein